MAPKTAKRAASQAPKDARPTKAAKADPLLEGVVDALENHAQDLPEPCKAMLLAVLPATFGTPAAERHEVQNAAVRMIEDVIETTRTKYSEEAEAEQGRAATADAEKATLEAAVGTVQAALDMSSEAQEACQKTLQEASEVVVAKKATLMEAESSKRAGSIAFEAAKGAKESFQAAHANHFKALRDGEEDGAKPSQDASAHYATLSPMVSKIGLDESLLTALPSSAAKSPKSRGPFDQMVIEQLEKSLDDHIAKLGETVDTAAPEAARLAGLVEDAQKALEEATAIQSEAAGELKEAQASCKEAADGVTAAKERVTANEAAYGAATKVRDEKAEALKGFEMWNVASFKQLKDKAATAAVAAPKEVPEAPTPAPVQAAGA